MCKYLSLPLAWWKAENAIDLVSLQENTIVITLYVFHGTSREKQRTSKHNSARVVCSTMRCPLTTLYSST